MNAHIISLHVMMLTYECWAIPFRLAIMHRFHWIDVSMDAVALLTLTHGILSAVFTDHERARWGCVQVIYTNSVDPWIERRVVVSTQ